MVVVAGVGPAPKDPARRARRNADPVPLRVIESRPVEQPRLPDFQVVGDDGLEEFQWPDATRTWWRMWAESPLSDDFTETDWSFLLDTAVLHARFWLGDVKAAGELRLRVAKFGATPEDRARLRIQFATADDVEEKTHSRSSVSSARARSKGKSLRAVGD